MVKTNTSESHENNSISHQSKAQSSTASSDVWNFMTDTSTSRTNIDPMIDTCAQQTVIGTTTLSKYTHKIEANTLQKLPPMASTHRFGKSGATYGTLYSVKVPIPVSDK